MSLGHIQEQIANFVETNKQRTTVNEHPRESNGASDGPRPLRGAAAIDRVFLPAPPKRLSMLGCLAWLAQPRNPTQAAATGTQRSTL